MTSSPAQPAAMIQLNKFVRAPRERVFQALTRAEEYGQWFVPGPDATCSNVIIEPQPGGRFRVEMETGHGTMVGAGKFLDIVENRKITYTLGWNLEPGVEAESVVTFELFDADNPYDEGDTPGTEIILTHEKLNTAVERSEHHGGWVGCLRGLGFHVRGVDPREAMYGKTPAASPEN